MRESLSPYGQSFGGLTMANTPSKIVCYAVLSVCLTGMIYASDVHQAAGNGNSSVLNQILNRDAAQTNARDQAGNTPLHLACEKGHTDAANLLLSMIFADSSPQVQDSF